MSDNFFKISKGLNLTPQASEPANPSNGDIYFDSALNKFRRYQNGSWGEFSSGSSGLNFITNGDAESDTNGWSTYADATGTRPVDGTAGSPNVTFTRTTTAPLASVGSFLFTKDAANRQGQGASFLFTVDPAYRAKVLTIEMDYIVNSGTFVAGTSSTDSDVIAYIYDVTNATLIEPSSFKLLSNNTSISDKFSATFQTSATGTQYRLILHVASVSALAYVLKLDNISVSPSKYVYGSPITDWQSYVPTGSLTTNTTYSGKWRRVGQNAEVQVRMSFAGALNAVGGSTITFPAQAPLSLTSQVSQQIGTGRFEDIGNNRFFVQGLASTSTAFTLRVLVTSGTFATDADVTNTVPFTAGNTDVLDITVSYIVDGWSSSVQMSDQADTRLVAAVAFNGGGQTITSSTTTKITGFTGNIVVDTHGGVVNDTYVVRVAGNYAVNANLRLTSTGTIGTFTGTVRVNGVDIFASEELLTAVTFNYVVQLAWVLALKAGDVVEFMATQNTGANRTTSGCYFNIQRLSGPSAIAESEHISCRYTLSAGPTISNSGADILVTFLTKNHDTHNAYNTSTGKFTAPIAGRYRISSSTWYAIATYTAGNGLYMSIYKNVILYSYGTLVVAPGLANILLAHAVSDTVDLLAGETIEVRARNARSAGSTNLTTSVFENYLTIEKIK